MTTPSTPTETEPKPTRRTWFGWLTTVFGAIAAMLVAFPFLGYLFGIRKQKASWLRLGSIDKYPLNKTMIETFINPLQQPWDGIVAETNVFVRNEGQDSQQKAQFRVLAVNCAHLGCPVSWFPQSGLFMCPCHGGVYYSNGERASGPPPRGLYHCAWRIQDGYLEIQAPHYPTLQAPLVSKTEA